MFNRTLCLPTYIIQTGTRDAFMHIVVLIGKSVFHIQKHLHLELTRICQTVSRLMIAVSQVVKAIWIVTQQTELVFDDRSNI